ncbi:MAG: hypothetical protein LH610_04130 [Sphingomonas bacterium]|nr:hypothetical protein [Sphingomonas bacterium]
MRHVLTAVTSLSLLIAPTAAAAQQAGQLIAAEPMSDTPGGMQAWRVRYWTSDGAGRPCEVTAGLVAVKRGYVVVAPDYSGIANRFAGRPAHNDCGRG